MGRETDAVAFFAELAEATYRYDFYQTLRRIECLYATKPRWGEALLPSEEPVRLGQDPDLSFAPAPWSMRMIGSDVLPSQVGGTNTRSGICCPVGAKVYCRR